MAYGRSVLTALALTLALRPLGLAAGTEGERAGPEEVCARISGLIDRLGDGSSCSEAKGRLRLRLPEVGLLSLDLSARSPREGRREMLGVLDGLLASGEPPRPRSPAGEVVFASGLVFSDRLSLSDDGTYHDAWTGRRLRFTEAYRVYVDETPGAPRWGRTAVESTISLGAFTIWYWAEATLNSKDWEYYDLSESLRNKFVTFEAWRFDDNRLHLNTPGHVLGGGAYYLFARANDLGAGTAFGAALAGSTAWELFTEYREIFAINDVVVGSFGSMALGEPIHQLGELFTRSRRGPVGSGLALLFGAPQELHRWLDGAPPRLAPELDAFGLASDRWHQLTLYTGAALARGGADRGTSTADVVLGFDTEIVTLPSHRRAVTGRRFVLEPLRTRLGVDLRLGAGDRSDLVLRANTMFLGLHDQALVPKGRFLQGHSLLLGLATDFRQVDRNRSEFFDVHGSVGLVGPAVDLTLLTGGWDLRFVLEAYPDFALVRARALDAWAADHSLEDTKSVLRAQGYYYALGATAFAAARIARGPFSGGAELTVHHFDSIEGLDRRQDEVRDDFGLVDGERLGRVWAGVAVPRSPLRVVLSWEDRQRWGSIGAVVVTDREQRLVGRLALAF